MTKIYRIRLNELRKLLLEKQNLKSKVEKELAKSLGFTDVKLYSVVDGSGKEGTLQYDVSGGGDVLNRGHDDTGIFEPKDLARSGGLSQSKAIKINNIIKNVLSKYDIESIINELENPEDIGTLSEKWKNDPTAKMINNKIINFIKTKFPDVGTQPEFSPATGMIYSPPGGLSHFFGFGSS
jgi:hypothetical protein